MKLKNIGPAFIAPLLMPTSGCTQINKDTPDSQKTNSVKPLPGIFSMNAIPILRGTIPIVDNGIHSYEL